MTPTLHGHRLAELKKFARRFRTPHDIQVFLNETPYSSHKICLSPWRVIQERHAHCAEGAYFAAAVFSLWGLRPLVVDLLAENDDDHIIAPFRVNGLWGAVAKSNTTVLRYREPVYRNLRELVMSYFDMYFNTNGVKSLRGYSRPVNLARIGGKHWMTSGDDLNFIGDRLTALPHIPLIDKKMRADLAPTDDDLGKPASSAQTNWGFLSRAEPLFEIMRKIDCFYRIKGYSAFVLSFARASGLGFFLFF